MPKLRNSGSDIGGFTQWLGRKCRNHNPLKELGMATGRAKAPDRYKTEATDTVYTLARDESVLIYKQAGRTFAVKVEELAPDALDGEELVKVGF